MYVTYQYYKNSYEGVKVDEQSFPQYELKARVVLENYTLKPKQMYHNVLQGEYSDNLRLAMCELIDNTKEEEELLEMAEKGLSMQMSGASSETVKDHTVTFDAKGNSVDKVKDYIRNKDIQVMAKYLYPTNLLSRGVSFV